MAAPSDHGSEAADALKRQASCACDCSCDREEEPMYHERKLSGSTSFSSPAASPAPSCASSSTDYHPAANKLSSESIPFAVPGPDDLAKLSSISSTSSYESFFHIEASDFGAGAGAEFLDFETAAAATTLAPAIQTMKAGQQGGAAAAYDPKRLPSSMFRTRSTSPAEWSATSNESLFSIQLSSNSGDLTALYADLYYDAAGLARFPSTRKLPSLSSSSSARSGGLCVTQDCARCSGGCSKTRKSVRFAATESVSGECKHSVVVSTLEVAMKETTTEARPASATKAGAGGGWCELGCCLASPPKVWTWWPRCCGCCGCGCQCKWWL